MMRLTCAAMLAAVALLAGVGGARADTAGFDTGLIPHPAILLPDGPAKGAIFLFSSEAGWSADDAATAERLRAAGAAVVGIDLPAYLAGLDAAGQDCVYLVSDFERLGHALERKTAATTFSAPIVAGIGRGGALALDVLTQAPADTLGAVIAADPAAGVPLKTALCTSAARSEGPEGSAYALPAGAPTAALSLVLSAEAPAESVAQSDALTKAGVLLNVRHATAPAQTALGDALVAAVASSGPGSDAQAIVELPAKPSHGTMAIMLSGDGGWRDLDKQVAGQLQADGIPTVGLDALRWFWSPKTPQQAADEIAHLIDVYSARWGVERVLLAGYSFGADVLPETYLALPQEARDRVAQISLLAPSQQADWQITVSGWLGSASAKARPTGPALAKIPGSILQCIQGQEETDSACPGLQAQGAEVIVTKGGHHFDGDYQALAKHLVGRLGQRATVTTTAAKG